MARCVVVILFLALLAPILAEAESPKPISPVVQVILTPAQVAAAKLGPLMDAVAVTPDGISVISADDQLWLVGAAGILPVGKIRGVHSFTFTPEGLLVGVKGRDLVYLTPNGTLKVFFKLPSGNMAVVSGVGDSLLLFGPDGSKGYGLYSVRPGRHITKVLDAPKPITAAAQIGNRFLLVTGGALYGVAGHKLHLLAGEPNGILTSVAIDAAGGRIFLSDGAHIFRFNDKAVVPVAGDMGGTLRWYGGGLLVFDAPHRSLVRLVGLP